MIGISPELQGYFKEQKKGILYVHFAVLITDTHEELNIALAGPAHFTLQKNGIGFWLNTKKGFLYHVSDSIPKKLFSIKSFVWYLVDVTYDIDQGTYDLVIHEEYLPEPVVSLENQRNASNNPGSAIDKFSFIGDKGEDTSNVIYFVDDIIIGTDAEITQLPFIAPGRRKLFVDSWDELQFRLRESPGCIPAVNFSDFGISASDINNQKGSGYYYLLNDIISNNISEYQLIELTQNSTGDIKTKLKAILEWNSGCDFLKEEKYQEALEKFNYALKIVPEGRIFALSRVLALSSLKRWEDLDASISYMYTEWQNDSRFAILQAIVGLSKGDLESAESWLEEPAIKAKKDFGEDLPDSIIKRIWASEIDRDLIETLKKYYPKTWHSYIEHALIAEQYYYVLLWQGLYNEAKTYSINIAERLDFLGAPKSQWLERAGDALFFQDDLQGAQAFYEDSLEQSKDPIVFLKLSDVYFLLQDNEKEKFYREKIYGSLLYKNQGLK